MGGAEGLLESCLRWKMLVFKWKGVIPELHPGGCNEGWKREAHGFFWFRSDDFLTRNRMGFLDSLISPWFLSVQDSIRDVLWFKFLAVAVPVCQKVE